MYISVIDVARYEKDGDIMTIEKEIDKILSEIRIEIANGKMNSEEMKRLANLNLVKPMTDREIMFHNNAIENALNIIDAYKKEYGIKNHGY